MGLADIRYCTSAHFLMREYTLKWYQCDWINLLFRMVEVLKILEHYLVLTSEDVMLLAPDPSLRWGTFLSRTSGGGVLARYRNSCKYRFRVESLICWYHDRVSLQAS